MRARASNLVPADVQQIGRAAEILEDGGLVALPTETVYGLGADATNDRAVASIFAAKGRPVFNPVIVHFRSKEEAEGPWCSMKKPSSSPRCSGPARSR